VSFLLIDSALSHIKVREDPLDDVDVVEETKLEAEESTDTVEAEEV